MVELERMEMDADQTLMWRWSMWSTNAAGLEERLALDPTPQSTIRKVQFDIS